MIEISRKTFKIIIIIFSLFVLSIAVFAFLVLKGFIILNDPSMDKYPVRGVDVSNYQGEIDWNVLSSQNIDFAFIKATEGSSFIDESFNTNLQNALKTNLKVGVYHFFSFDSSGENQADNFINAVPKNERMLPPVIDVEFYGNKNKNPPDKSTVYTQLNTMIQRIKAYYNKKPIIYATEKSYKMYIAGNFNDCDIWIRNVYFSPSLTDERNWTFWQYTDKMKLKGYNGVEENIDMNVFNGTMEQFSEYSK